MFIFVIVIALCFLVERLVCFLSAENNGKIIHRWLTILPLTTYSLIILCAIIDFIQAKGSLNYFLSILGVFFISTGVILRRKTVGALGNQWSAYIKIFPEQKLIKDGPYKIMRHPYLFSVVCELIGFCLLLNSFYSLALVFLIQVPILVLRGYSEEKILYSLFNKEYAEYRDKASFL